ncbi:MAG: hypothetical protein OEY52_02035 [Gammaproteobacteria bacterium]|nr:hypothetical protein [Gammaproteobacteria bacterium]
MQTARNVSSNDHVNNLKKKKPYKVIQVEKIETPEGMNGDNWYRYVIDYGKSQIEGKKPGSLKLVKQHAESVADDLNSRNTTLGNTGAYAQRNNKK